MSGYIIHFDNETELAHYGVKGMKWKHKKSAKKPLDPRKARRFEKNALNKRSKIVENKIYKDLQSGKKMNKSYKVGKSRVYINKDKSGTTTEVISGGVKNRYDKAAQRALNKAWKRNFKARESKKPINRGKKLIKKWLNKLF